MDGWVDRRIDECTGIQTHTHTHIHSGGWGQIHTSNKHTIRDGENVGGEIERKREKERVREKERERENKILLTYIS